MSNKRILLYTGKGGVGKTSIAAATALRAADRGIRTIVFSTDAAHSLADCFDLPVGPEPTAIAPELWAQEMEITTALDRYWGKIRDWISALLAWRGMDQVIAEELAILPGMEELASLLHITHYHDTEDYDLIVVDCAPTGETLRLLSFPEVLRWWMTHLFPIHRQAANVLRPFVRPLLDIPVPDDTVFESIQQLYAQLDRMRTLLCDPALSSVRLVVNPEKMVIKEAQRTYTYLSLYGYGSDAVICNRILPADVGSPYFAAWQAQQSQNLALIESAFAPLPILRVPLFEQEVLGLPMLRRLADALYGESDPAGHYAEGRAQTFREQNGTVVLCLALPFASREAIHLTRNGDELYVQVGS
ncbi:MAG: TRC40/GET3/ArsA family transport-energizing ATPase, partial [Chloroflexi bacterium]|nr:TRC40/GET3/ArsA family transport-energizing ATPase [Chloroflexota bacterium]